MSKLVKSCCPDCLEDVEPIYDRKCTFLFNDEPIKEEISAICPICHFSTGYYDTVFDCAMAWNNNENRDKNLKKLAAFEKETYDEPLAE